MTTLDSLKNGPLSGLRVLDLTQMLAGPICGMRFADLGAEVIKVEPPEGGEWTRTHGFANADIGGETTAFLGLNRNKKSVAINLKSKEGVEIFYKLIKSADILIENYKRGTTDRLGIGYSKLSEVNPRLIYASISGYGEEGPLKDRPGQDLLVQAMSGSMWSVGKKSDPPTAGALWAVDAMTGYSLGMGILSAVLARQQTGKGQKVHVSMLGVVMDCQCQELVTAFNLNMKPERSEKPFAHAWVTAPYGAYQTKNGWMVISQVALHILGEALNNDRLREMKEWSAGIDYRDEVYEIVKSIMPQKTTEEWIVIFDQYKLWGGKVYDYQQLYNDPHVQETGMVTSVQHSKLGEIKMPNIPIRFSDTPGSIRTPPPMLGQHTAEVLEAIVGLSPSEITDLQIKKVLK